MQVWDQLTVVDGLLYRVFKDQEQNGFSLLSPRSTAIELLAALNEGVGGGHLGQENLADLRNSSTGQRVGAKRATRKHTPASRRAPLGTFQRITTKISM